MRPWSPTALTRLCTGELQKWRRYSYRLTICQAICDSSMEISFIHVQLNLRIPLAQTCKEGETHFSKIHSLICPHKASRFIHFLQLSYPVNSFLKFLFCFLTLYHWYLLRLIPKPYTNLQSRFLLLFIPVFFYTSPHLTSSLLPPHSSPLYNFST